MVEQPEPLEVFATAPSSNHKYQVYHASASDGKGDLTGSVSFIQEI
jgi:hypothetical protein